jgi:hypothetical protein
MADAATDSYDRDWTLAMASSDQTALYKIDGRSTGFGTAPTVFVS